MLEKEETINISNDQNIIIDLKGNTITTSNEYLINNQGELKIIDNAEDQTGRIISNKSSLLYNKAGGKIELQSGKLELTKSSSNAIYGEENSIIKMTGGIINITQESDVAIKSAGEILIESGTITGIGRYASAIVLEGEKAQGTITGGTINVEAQQGYLINISKGKLEVTGGEIRNTYSDIHGVIGNANGIVEIKGGILETKGYRTYAISNNGTTTISGGTIISSSGGIENYQGTVDITGGEITAEGGIDPWWNAISGLKNNTNSTMKITGGSIVCNTYPGIVNEGILQLGENDGTVSTELPIITGASYGISNSGTFNFYDGRISGGTKAIYGNVTNIADGYKIETATTDGLEIAQLAIIATDESVVKVGSIYYMDLQTAINSCLNETQTTITLLKGITLESDITISAGKNIILDINGNTINNQETYYIINNGTLKLVDSTGGDTTIIEGIITNNGTLESNGIQSISNEEEPNDNDMPNDDETPQEI